MLREKGGKRGVALSAYRSVSSEAIICFFYGTPSANVPSYERLTSFRANFSEKGAH